MSTRVGNGESIGRLNVIFFPLPSSPRLEVVELLVATLFSNETPSLSPPSTGLAGFLRFLVLLSSHDWDTAPLLVDPQKELSPADRAAAEEAFSRSRERGKILLYYTRRRMMSDSGGQCGYTAPTEDGWYMLVPQDTVAVEVKTLEGRGRSFRPGVWCTCNWYLLPPSFVSS